MAKMVLMPPETMPVTRSVKFLGYTRTGPFFHGHGLEPRQLLAESYDQRACSSPISAVPLLSARSLAAEVAAVDAKGPASLRIGLLDAIFALSKDQVCRGVKLHQLDIEL